VNLTENLFVNARLFNRSEHFGLAVYWSDQYVELPRLSRRSL